VPTFAFRQNGYNGAAVSLGQPSFISASPGHGSGTRITTIVDLGKFQPGDTVRVQFYAANDSNTAGAVPNWEIDSVQLSQGNYPLFAILSVGASGVNAESGTNAPFAYQWFRNTGSGFVAVPGANTATYWFLPQPADVGATFRAELYIPGASATSGTMMLGVGQPVLKIVELPGGQVVLSWTGPYCLQEASTLTLPTTTWTSSAAVNGVPFNPGVGNKFYRLTNVGCP
jgi:hypothetical protein